jgi:hypothetical protein
MGDRGKTGRNLYWEIGSQRTTLEGPRLQANVAVCLPMCATKRKGVSGRTGFVPGGRHARPCWSCRGPFEALTTSFCSDSAVPVTAALHPSRL